MNTKITLGLVATCLIPLSYASTSIAGIHGAKSQLLYQIQASQPRLIRRVTGPVVATVNGVAAEPVDSFVWDGNGAVYVKGQVQLKIDPITNTGKIHAEWTDDNGEWTYLQESFAPPAHPTGLRIGSSASATELEPTDPVTTNVYIHGNTGAAAAVLPTVFNLITTWGPAKITLNGLAFDNPFDGPTPQWAGHTMTTLGVRNADGSVRTTSGAVYNPSEAANGAVDQNDLEFHLVFHDAPGPAATANVPPPLSFFYHLTFEKVNIKIKQR